MGGPGGKPKPQGMRARQRAETRERIFETALREFRDVGFAAAQIDRIAKAAGVARGTFYFHFPTKDDVLLELARRINGRVARRVAVLDESRPTLQELLLRVNDACIDEHSRVGEAGLLGELLSLYVRRPHDINDPTHNLPMLSDELARHLQSAADRGELRSSLSADQIAIVVMTSLFGIYTRIPQGEELRTACEALIELLVKGLRSAR
ncbi:MAG: TetR/AcrR family transcriptional regulator [bacterium]|nr:TetR/AcrR family transcriptional regulator [bacterium]